MLYVFLLTRHSSFDMFLIVMHVVLHVCLWDMLTRVLSISVLAAYIQRYKRIPFVSLTFSWTELQNRETSILISVKFIESGTGSQLFSVSPFDIVSAIPYNYLWFTPNWIEAFWHFIFFAIEELIFNVV